MRGRFPAQLGAQPAFVYAKQEQIGLTAIEVIGDAQHLIARRAMDEALALPATARGIAHASALLPRRSRLVM